MDRPPRTQQKPEPPKPPRRNTDPERVVPQGTGRPIPIQPPPARYVGESSLPASARSAHQRLFGRGAKVGADPGSDASITAMDETIVARTPDEHAWAQRPRAADHGKDINLPLAKKPAAKPATKRATTRKVTR